MSSKPIQVAADNQKAIHITQQAHAAELAGKTKEAYELHKQASSLLTNVVAKGVKKSEERRRAKLQLRAANDRQDVLHACVEGTGGVKPPQPLPTLATAEMEFLNPNGAALLTLVEIGALPQLQQHQGAGGTTQFITPLLSPSLPDVTYHVCIEPILRHPSLWFYLHIKDESKSQTLYTLSGVKHPKYQIPSCTLSRAAEYHMACAHITVGSVRPEGSLLPGNSAAANCEIGRPLTIATRTGTVVDAPDRAQKKWTPRRFTYGGLRFAWKDLKEPSLKRTLLEDPLTIESLYEVKKEWADPGSKTGKKLDETFDRALVWGESHYIKDSSYTVHMVGGLDQMFREFLLASLATRILIGCIGHYH